MKISDINNMSCEDIQMTKAEATSIISIIAIDHDTGILETLQYMNEIYEESNNDWKAKFTLEQRQAFHIVMDGMKEMFFG
jgi:hypothetical protein